MSHRLPNLLALRHTQALKQAAEATNRTAGMGAGYGQQVHAQLGASGGSGNFSALAYAIVPGTSVAILVGHPCSLRLEAILVAKITAGANNGKVRLNAGTLGTTGDALYGAPYFVTASIFFDLPWVQPGYYTCEVDAAVDNVATTLNLAASLVISQWLA
ncbi:MAG: hypothetical protein ACHQ0J_10525 [Candidatus Dormibacterales bacterium]